MKNEKLQEVVVVASMVIAKIKEYIEDEDAVLDSNMTKKLKTCKTYLEKLKLTGEDTSIEPKLVSRCINKVQEECKLLQMNNSSNVDKSIKFDECDKIFLSLVQPAIQVLYKSSKLSKKLTKKEKKYINIAIGWFESWERYILDC